MLLLSDDPTLDNEISIDTGTDKWVNDFKDDVTAGYTYYNDTVNPYTIRTITHNDDGSQTITSAEEEEHAIPVLDEILVPDTMSTQTYYVSIIVEGIAYSGNIYKEDLDRDTDPDGDYQIDKEAYPFGLPETLPSGWTAWRN